ncbi:uncharacterized protein LOC111243159 [Varroa destructor]|uniref:Uncharacterized protein n=1 Tax=Varroa destructor TaxID=109461 RepID=A0A7M7M8L1_VARDE|nr:uncharacterized protein LOC111243159 [Varroa destructor]
MLNTADLAMLMTGQQANTQAGHYRERHLQRRRKQTRPIINYRYPACTFLSIDEEGHGKVVSSFLDFFRGLRCTLRIVACELPRVKILDEHPTSTRSPLATSRLNGTVWQTPDRQNTAIDVVLSYLL